jgi:hypothetical protein
METCLRIDPRQGGMISHELTEPERKMFPSFSGASERTRIVQIRRAKITGREDLNWIAVVDESVCDGCALLKPAPPRQVAIPFALADRGRYRQKINAQFAV